MELNAVEASVELNIEADATMNELSQIQLALIGGGNADISLN
jgi:hypothetical protein